MPYTAHPIDKLSLFIWLQAYKLPRPGQDQTTSCTSDQRPTTRAVRYQFSLTNKTKRLIKVIINLDSTLDTSQPGPSDLPHVPFSQSQAILLLFLFHNVFPDPQS